MTAMQEQIKIDQKIMCIVNRYNLLDYRLYNIQCIFENINMDKSHKNYKTSLCRHYMTKGYCSLSNTCHFAHGEEELRNKVDPIPQFVPPMPKPVSIYKTQLCKYFMNGYCRNDTMCPFAHGQKDLHCMIIEPPHHIPQKYQPIKQPNWGKAGDFLFSILKTLQTVFANDAQMMKRISKGHQLIKKGQIHQGNAIILQIVQDQSLPKTQKQQVKTLMQNAINLHKMGLFPY